MNWRPIKEVPVGQLVLVVDEYQRYALRFLTPGGDWYDENEVIDDSGITYHEWHELPLLPQ